MLDVVVVGLDVVVVVLDVVVVEFDVVVVGTEVDDSSDVVTEPPVLEVEVGGVVVVVFEPVEGVFLDDVLVDVEVVGFFEEVP